MRTEPKCLKCGKGNLCGAVSIEDRYLCSNCLSDILNAARLVILRSIGPKERGAHHEPVRYYEVPERMMEILAETMEGLWQD